MSFTKFKHYCMGITVALYLVAVLMLCIFDPPNRENHQVLANYLGLGLAVWMGLLILLVRPAYRAYQRWTSR